MRFQGLLDAFLPLAGGRRRLGLVLLPVFALAGSVSTFGTQASHLVLGFLQTSFQGGSSSKRRRSRAGPDTHAVLSDAVGGSTRSCSINAATLLVSNSSRNSGWAVREVRQRVIIHSPPHRPAIGRPSALRTGDPRRRALPTPSSVAYNHNASRIRGSARGLAGTPFNHLDLLVQPRQIESFNEGPVPGERCAPPEATHPTPDSGSPPGRVAASTSTRTTPVRTGARTGSVGSPASNNWPELGSGEQGVIAREIFMSFVYSTLNDFNKLQNQKLSQPLSPGHPPPRDTSLREPLTLPQLSPESDVACRNGAETFNVTI